jgi:hypothetical protein
MQTATIATVIDQQWYYFECSNSKNSASIVMLHNQYLLYLR